MITTDPACMCSAGRFITSSESRLIDDLSYSNPDLISITSGWESVPIIDCNSTGVIEGDNSNDEYPESPPIVIKRWLSNTEIWEGKMFHTILVFSMN